MRCTLWDGLTIEQGTPADYTPFKAFHYRGGRPGAVTRVFVARYREADLGRADAQRGLPAGILIEALPALACALRSVALPGQFACKDQSLAAARLNRGMRTIARVVVHPAFRSLGLAAELVRHLLKRPETPYIEALAAMGRVHPFFEKAGMTPYDRPALPDAVRLTAALEAQGLAPLDLITLTPEKLSPFLQRELLRFARKRQALTPAAALAEARTRLLSQPVYYLWKA
jgi:GNAT superfamily N-acetyltransferase